MDGAELTERTAKLAMKAANTALDVRPDDVDVASKASQVLRTCGPILEAAQRQQGIRVEKVLELWNQ